MVRLGWPTAALRPTRFSKKFRWARNTSSSWNCMRFEFNPQSWCFWIKPNKATGLHDDRNRILRGNSGYDTRLGIPAKMQLECKMFYLMIHFFNWRDKVPFLEDVWDGERRYIVNGIEIEDFLYYIVYVGIVTRNTHLLYLVGKAYYKLKIFYR